MTERIRLTEEYLKSIGTLKGKKGLDDEEIKRILEDREKVKNLEEDVQRWKNNFGNLETEWENQKIQRLEAEGMIRNLKQKLEKIKELDPDDWRGVSARIFIMSELKEILKENRK